MPVEPDLTVYSERKKKRLGADAEVKEEIKHTRVEAGALAIVGQVTVGTAPAAVMLVVEAAPVAILVHAGAAAEMAETAIAVVVKVEVNL